MARRRNRSLHSQIESFTEDVVKHAQKERDFEAIAGAFAWFGQYHHLVAYLDAAKKAVKDREAAAQEESSDSEPEAAEQESTTQTESEDSDKEGKA